MARYLANGRTLLSIFPIALETPRPHQGRFVYEHPAVKRDEILVRTFAMERLSNTDPGVSAEMAPYTDERRPCQAGEGYALLKVWDTFQWNRDFSQDRERYKPDPIDAHTVARDLVRAWALDCVKASANHHPGIIILEGEEPTEAELAQVRLMQESYFRTLVQDAHELFARQNLKDISDLHRTAARYLGVENVPWLVPISETRMKNCVACGNSIKMVALRCQHCQVDLPKFALENGVEVDPQVDPVLADAVNRLMSTRGRKAAA